MKPLADVCWIKADADQALHDDAATFQLAYDAWENSFHSCFNLSVLLLLLMISAMMLLLLTRVAALATVVLLTLMLLSMVSTVARPISTTILMRELWWHLRWATLKINIYSACVVLCGILQSHLPADLLDAWLDLLDMIRRMVPFSYNTIWPEKAWVSPSLFQVFLIFLVQLTRGDGFVPGIGHILCAPQEYPLPPQRTGHVNQLYHQLRDPPRYFLGRCNPKLVCYTALLIAHASCSPLIAHELLLHLPVRRLYGPTCNTWASAAMRLPKSH